MEHEKKKDIKLITPPGYRKNIIDFLETITYTNVSTYPYGMGKEWEK